MSSLPTITPCGRVTQTSPRPPASLAKLISALVLLRGSWDDTRVIRISKAAATIEGTQLGLREGEQIRAGDALTAMLLRSANDACLALAEDADGSAAAFVVRMNALAAEMGLRHTVFRTPCGLDAPGQYTTANDLLTLARAAMQRPEIAKRVGRDSRFHRHAARSHDRLYQQQCAGRANSRNHRRQERLHQRSGQVCHCPERAQWPPRMAGDAGRAQSLVGCGRHYHGGIHFDLANGGT